MIRKVSENPRSPTLRYAKNGAPCLPWELGEYDTLRVQLESGHVADVRAHAESEDPYECCGVLVGIEEGDNVRIRQVVRAGNIAEGDRRRSYQIDWRTLLATQRRARRQGASIIGFYHSHPDGFARPSQADVDAAWSDIMYVIVPVVGGVAGAPTAWRASPDSGGFHPVAVSVDVAM